MRNKFTILLTVQAYNDKTQQEKYTKHYTITNKLTRKAKTKAQTQRRTRNGIMDVAAAGKGIQRKLFSGWPQLQADINIFTI